VTDTVNLTLRVTKKWWVPWLAVIVALFPNRTDWLVNFIIDRGIEVEAAT